MKNYLIEGIEAEIIKRLDDGEKVYIESGAANDEITAYSIKKYGVRYVEKEITFTTSACIFPEKIILSNYDNVDTEYFNGKLFVHVWW